jgi:hypothetical protein
MRRLQCTIRLSSAALALVTVAIAVSIGLTAAPSDGSMAPTVSAAVVIARALIALGLIAFGVVLLRIASDALQSTGVRPSTVLTATDPDEQATR